MRKVYIALDTLKINSFTPGIASFFDCGLGQMTHHPHWILNYARQDQILEQNTRIQETIPDAGVL